MDHMASGTVGTYSPGNPPTPEGDWLGYCGKVTNWNLHGWEQFCLVLDLHPTGSNPNAMYLSLPNKHHGRVACGGVSYMSWPSDGCKGEVKANERVGL